MREPPQTRSAAATQSATRGPSAPAGEHVAATTLLLLLLLLPLPQRAAADDGGGDGEQPCPATIRPPPALRPWATEEGRVTTFEGFDVECDDGMPPPMPLSSDPVPSQCHYCSSTKMGVCSGGELTILPSVATYPQGIEYFKVTGSSIEAIPAKAFKGLQLKHIAIDNNPNLCGNLDDMAFSDVKGLESLNITRSGLKRINFKWLTGLDELKILSLEDNQIEFGEESDFPDDDDTDSQSCVSSAQWASEGNYSSSDYKTPLVPELLQLDLAKNNLRNLNQSNFEWLRFSKLKRLNLRGISISTVEKVRGQPGLEYFPFYERYEPPPPPEPGQRRPPEEIEAELKKQEKELEKLALITINLPESVLWFEPPIIVGWNEKQCFWDTSEFHDIRFNEEKQSVSFRTGLLSGPIALASYRYSNLPFQAWDIRPGASETVILSLTASVLVVELTFKDSEVCLSSLQNGPNNALQDIVGTYFSPSVLMKKLKGGGVDVFPQYDAMCYIDGPAGKHAATENHLYHCMAMVCSTHNFAWSRWNLQAGRKNLVLQMREFIQEEKLPSFKTLLVTPLKTTIVDCTEVSQSFISDSVPDIGYYTDLLQLLQDKSSYICQRKMSAPNLCLVKNVGIILSKTKILTFS